MNVFELREQLVRDFADYTRSFIVIRDERIRALVDDELDRGLLWPDPIVQLNPAFEPGETIDELVDQGVLHQECRRIFRRDKSPEDQQRRSLRLDERRIWVNAVEARTSPGRRCDLMTQPAVRDAFRRAESIQAMAARFGVSQEAMHWRLYNFGLLVDPAT